MTHPSRLNPVSKKPHRQERQRLYRVARREYMEEYPDCEVRFCSARSVDLHHKKGRLGALLYDKRFFMATCREHHDWMKSRFEWAKANSYILDRLAKGDGV